VQRLLVLHTLCSLDSFAIGCKNKGIPDRFSPIFPMWFFHPQRKRRKAKPLSTEQISVLKVRKKNGKVRHAGVYIPLKIKPYHATKMMGIHISETVLTLNPVDPISMPYYDRLYLEFHELISMFLLISHRFMI